MITSRENLTVMVVDSSARAHALVNAYLRSPNVRRVIIPGNNFIPFQAQKEVILEPANIKDPDSVLGIARRYQPDLIDVCQDDALAAGVVDALKEMRFNVFGPSRAAAKIEWDKAWSREFMRRYRIPHPEFQVFSDPSKAEIFLRESYEQSPDKGYFVKAQGLCAGKGAIGAWNLETALQAVKEMASFGEAGRTFLIEECMKGEEASFYVASDGKTSKRFKSAKDYKTRDNFDAGPNTGGMGTVSPALVVQKNGLDTEIHKEIMDPIIRALASEETPYVGILYGGLMVMPHPNWERNSGHWEVKVVEFNARWGAPEAEVVIPGIQTPMDEIVNACLQRKLIDQPIEEDHLTRVCIVGSSRGYPDSAEVEKVKGKQIFGLEDAMRLPHVTVYGAGINVDSGKFYAKGGRLFSLVAEGRNIREARERALEGMARIYIEGNGLQYRTDIGHHDMKRYYGG